MCATLSLGIPTYLRVHPQVQDPKCHCCAKVLCAYPFLIDNLLLPPNARARADCDVNTDFY